jgi:hypothetical protein
MTKSDYDDLKLTPEMAKKLGGVEAPAPTGRFKAARGGAAAREPPADQHIGCPLWWFRRALAAVKSKDQLAVALYIYRRRVVCKSATIKISNEKLRDDLGIERGAKYRALKCLAAAGLISYEMCSGNAALVTILGRS